MNLASSEMLSLFGSLAVILLTLWGITLGFQFWKTKLASANTSRRVEDSAWSTTEVCIVLGIFIFLSTQSISLSKIFEKWDWFQTRQEQAEVAVYGMLAVYAIFLITIHWILRHKKLSWSQAFGLREGRPKAILAAAGVALMAVQMPVSLISALTERALSEMGIHVEPQGAIQIFSLLQPLYLKVVFAVMATIGAPIVEEIIFRGILYPYAKKKMGMARAATLTSFIFAVIHFHLPILLPLFILGLVLTMAYEWRGNLLTSICLHAAFNTINLVVMFLNDAP